MARSRMLKPEFFSDKKITSLNVWARLLFAGMWTIADRRGRMKDNAKTIEGDVFPDEKVNVERFLTELAKAGLIIRYFAEGEHYIQITNFERHQYPHTKEAESKYPPVPSTMQCPVQSPVKDEAEPGVYTDNGLRITDNTNTDNGVGAVHPASPETEGLLPFEPPGKDITLKNLIDHRVKFPGLDIETEYEKYQDYNATHGRKVRSHPAAFRNWLRKAKEFQDERSQTNGKPARSQPATAPADSPFAYLSS